MYHTKRLTVTQKFDLLILKAFVQGRFSEDGWTGRKAVRMLLFYLLVMQSREAGENTFSFSLYCTIPIVQMSICLEKISVLFQTDSCHHPGLDAEMTPKRIEFCCYRTFLIKNQHWLTAQ